MDSLTPSSDVGKVVSVDISPEQQEAERDEFERKETVKILLDAYDKMLPFKPLNVDVGMAEAEMIIRKKKRDATNKV